MPQPATDAPPVFPRDRDHRCPFAPPPELMAMQQGAPVTEVETWNGKKAWVVTRQHLIREVLSTAPVSVDVRLPAYPHAGPGLASTKDFTPTILTLDNPEHDVRRRLVASFFMPKRVAAQRPRIQALVDGLLDAMEASAGPVDLLHAFALPIPSTIISVVLGVPQEDHEFFQSRSQAFLDNGFDPELRERYSAEFEEYLRRLLDSKREGPGEDVTTRLAALVDAGTIDEEQARRDLQLMLVAGHHSTANMITLAAYALMTHPERAAELTTTDDPRLAAAAVEELLRFITPLQSGRRRAVVEDFDLGGVMVHAGEGLIVANDAGNWDPEAYHHPDQLDFRRPVNHHGAFGFGVHQCLGQHLARLELQLALTTLFRRLPGLRSVTPATELDFRDHDVIYGIGNLLVTWDGHGAA